MVVLVGLAIDQIAQSGLSSLSVIYYSAQLFNDAGQEVEYFNMLLEGVKVVAVTPIMYNTKTVEKCNHMERVELRYERITWKYCDGNIQYTDAWNERATA
ncbi:hypothetical protein C6987_27220 [Klebsiella pneumoniae]|nr:hypothetical protein [Klebsiella pneumoniae]MBX4788287.1 hypothetical protein [Klebsiella pneumoniae]